MHRHIVQTPIWKKFKNIYGTEAFEAGGVIYTRHKIPFINKYYAYCPRVNPKDINFDELRDSLKENRCVAVSFDVPNVILGSEREKESIAIMDKYCQKSTRSEFAKGNVMLDLSLSEEDLYNGLHKKHRYNAKLALRKGVVVELAKDEKDFDDFYNLLSYTAFEQHFFVRPRDYYKKIWEVLGAEGNCFILTAKYEGEPLASWMLFVQDGVLYYPYGGSSSKHRNLFASTALGWEAIRLGKEKGCDLFDMWGAATDPMDESDPYHGFTTFKLRFGGVHINYISSYDFILNKFIYKFFTSANSIRWKLLRSGLIK